MIAWYWVVFMVLVAFVLGFICSAILVWREITRKEVTIVIDEESITMHPNVKSVETKND